MSGLKPRMLFICVSTVFLHACTHIHKCWYRSVISLSLCPSSSPFQAVFRKAMVLHEMGQVDESLQVFLHCLAVDEDFPCAKRQVEKVREFKRKSAGSVEK